MRLITSVLALPLVFLAGCGNDSPARLMLVADGFSFPLYVTSEPENALRLYVLEQNRGRIYLVENFERVSRPFLDIGDKVNASGLERGLLGLAFHPNYAVNGHFYVNYTAPSGSSGSKTVIERYTLSQHPDRADGDSAVVILEIEQPDAIHNGGMMAFGPDGYLYVATGDGGPGNDPENRAQSLDTLLGKILRIDVDSDFPYAIPEDNPFVGVAGARDEIWAYGLRNPWRFSFDRMTGDMYIGDVGERAREEINFEPFSSPGGNNYGWRVREGSICRPGQDACELPDAVEPIYEYEKLITASVTGGYVYRGTAIPEWEGHYFFGDFTNGKIWSFRFDGAEVTDFSDWSGPLRAPVLLPSYSSFGEDADGELYVVDYLSGGVYKIVPKD